MELCAPLPLIPAKVSCFLLLTDLASSSSYEPGVIIHSQFLGGETEALKPICCPKKGGSRAKMTVAGAEKVRPQPQEPRPYLVFVGGVEGNLGYFLVAFPHQLHGARGQLDAFEQGRLGGIPSHVPLRERVLSHRSAERGTQARHGEAGTTPTLSTGMLS